MRHNRDVPYRVLVAAGCILVGTLFWVGRLLFGQSPWSQQGSSLLALSLLLASAINVVALLLSPSRWVRNSIGASGGALASTAIAARMDTVWILAAATLVTGIAVVWTRPMDAWFSEVKPDRVPTKATILTLGLIWLPGIVGALGIPEVTPVGWVMAAGGVVGGWAYSRALPGALWALRLALPPLAVAASIGLWIPAAAGLLAAAACLTFLAWTADARLAVNLPGPRRVRPVSVLPEITPPGLMESAGYDRRGRPLRERS